MKKLVLRILSFMMLISVSLLAACGKETNAPTKGKSETNKTSQTQPKADPTLALDKSELNLSVFDSAKINATVENTTEAVAFVSSNENVVKVDAQGNVTVMGVGEATITATVAGLSKTCAVKVNAPTGDIEVYVELAEIDGFVGANQALNATAVYGDDEVEGATFSYSVDDSTVANVSADGTVALLKKGEATVTVSGTYKGIALVPTTIDVTVDDKVELVGAPTSNVNIYTFAGLDPQNPVPTTYQTEISAKLNGEATDATFSYEVDDECITVSATGLVEAVSFGHAKVTVKATIAGKEVTATFNVVVSKTEVAVEGPEKLGLNKAINPSALGIEDTVIALSIGGSNVEFEVVAGELVFDYSELQSGDDQEVVLDTETASFKFTTDTYDFNIGTKAEWVAFYTFASEIGKDGKDIRAFLSANIDIGGDVVMNGDLVGILNKHSSYLRYSLDGCGYTVSNLSAQWGALMNMGSKNGVKNTIKNIGFYNMTKSLTNGGGVMFNECNGTILDNVFVDVKATSNFGMGAGVFGNNVTNSEIKNSLVYASFTTPMSVFSYYKDGDSVNDVTDSIQYSNVYGVSSTSNGHGFGNAGDEVVYQNAAALMEVVTELPEGFNPLYWEMRDGMIVFKSAYDLFPKYETVTVNEVNPETVFNGAEITLSASLKSTFALEEAVDGITIEGNVLRIAETVPAGTTFKVVATYTDDLLGYQVVGKSETLEVKLSVKESLGEMIQIAKNRTANGVSEDLSKYAGLTIDQVTFAGKNVEYTFAENVLTIAQSNLTEHVDPQQLLIVGRINEGKYAISRDYQVLTMMIGNKDEMLAFKTNIDKWSPSKKAVYILFDNDIDMSAAGDWGISHWGSYGGNVINGVIDGQGHTINGLRITLGFTGIGEQGTLRNIAFTNVRKSGNGVATLGITLQGHLENVYIEGTMNENPAQASTDYAPIISQMESSATVSNCVFYIRGFVSAHNPGVAAFNSVKTGADAPTFTNTYVICGGTCNAMYPGITDGLYADYDAFKAIIPEIADNFSSDYWTVVNGALVMKSTANFYKLSLGETDTITTAEAYTGSSTEITASFPITKVEIVGTVEGASISGKNLVLTNDCNAATVTVKACHTNVFGTELSVEKEITVIKTVALDTKQVAGKNKETKAVTFDLSSLNVTEVTQLTYNNANITSFDFDASSKVLTLNYEDLASSGDYLALVIKAKAGENQLVLTDVLNVCDFAIAVKEDLTNFAKAFAAEHPSNGKYLYGVLTADIDYQNGCLQKDYGTAVGSYNNFNLNGDGHTLSNIEVINGFHGCFGLLKGTVDHRVTIRNISLINMLKSNPSNGGGIICNECSYALFENVYAETKLTGACSVASGFIGNASNNLIFRNVVVNTSLINNTYNALCYGNSGVTEITNTYVIAPVSTGYMYGTETKGLYASAADFAAAEKTLGGSFEQKADGLYFYGTKVVTYPAE